MMAAKMLCLLALAGLLNIAHSQLSLGPPCPPWSWTEAVTDPHLIVYGGATWHCAADGWRNYLQNKYFDLTAYAQGFWMKEVHIAFLTQQNRVTYHSTSAGLQFQLYDVYVGYTTSIGLIQAIPGGSDTVYIIDWNSWTLFVIQKPISFWDYYNIRVFSGHCIYKISCGLLVDGCPDDYFGGPWNPFKKRRSVPRIPEQKGGPSEKECHDCCTKEAPEEYYDICMIDCMATGNKEVCKEYWALKKMKEQSDWMGRRLTLVKEPQDMSEQMMQPDAMTD